MSLGLRIKNHLHAINDGAFAKELRKALRVEHSDLMAALLELGHEVIQGEDSRWYLDACAKLEEPEPEPDPVVSIAAIADPVAVDPAPWMDTLQPHTAEPVTEVPTTERPAKKSKIDLVLDVLRQKQQLGEGPYTYAQIAELVNEDLKYVRGLKKNITQFRPDELALWNSMIVVQDVLKNLRNGPRAAHRPDDLGLGAYRWKRLRDWLADERIAGRGPYTAKEICGRWCSVASLRQTQRAITALRQQGSDEDKKLAEQMIVYANPAFQKPVLPDDTAIAAALDDVRMKIIKKPPMAARWKVVCEGLDKIMEDLGLSTDHLTRTDLRGMAGYFGEMSD